MFPIEQSAFLRALGVSIGNSLWQVAALWLIYSGITSLFKLTASRKYQLSTIASLAGLVFFLTTLIITYAGTSPQVAYQTGVYSFESSEQLNDSMFVNRLLFFYHSVLTSLKSLSPYISCAYIFVSLVLVIRLINGFRQVRYFSTQGLGKIDVQWRLFVQQNADILQIKNKVRVFTSHYIQSPLTMGFLKPIILLPVACLASLTTRQVEAILLHELAHIRRHDYIINIFLQVAEISLFFNPFMRLLLKQIKQERENSCDDYVLQFQYSAKDYAKALLAIEQNSSATLLALSVKGNQSFQLLNRVKRMVTPQPQAFNYKQQLYMLLLLTVLTLGFTIIIPRPKIGVSQVAKESLTHNVAKGEPAKKTNSPKVTIGQSAPLAPASFDLVKWTKSIQTFAEHLDVKELEAKGKELGDQAEVLGEEYGERMEKQLQPTIDDATEWATAFAEKMSERKMIEAPVVDDESLHAKERLSNLADFDKLLGPIMIKVNEVLKAIPSSRIYTSARRDQRLAIPRPPAAPRFNSAIMTEVKMSLQKAREKVEAQIIKEKADAKIVSAQMKLRQLDLAKLQTEAAFKQMEGFRFNNNFNISYGPNAAEVDEAGDLENDREDGSSSSEPVRSNLQKFERLNIQAPLVNVKINDVLKNFKVEYKLEKNATGTRTRVISMDDNNDVELDIDEVDLKNVKSIDIHHEKRSKNGKQKNVVVIKITQTS